MRPYFFPHVIFIREYNTHTHTHAKNITQHILNGNMCGLTTTKLIIILFTMCSVFSSMYIYFTHIILLLIFIKILMQRKTMRRI